MNIEKKCKITLPDPEGQIDYRQRLLHQIIARFLGTATVISKGNDIYFDGTEEQKAKMQALVDTCTPEVDFLILEFLLAYFDRLDILVNGEVKITEKKIA